ncbi:MAG: tetratricopeptide repeat protein [Rhodoferax sp.]|nr:tetratricopeptide repeat protein [Rhodoferax sp.]
MSETLEQARQFFQDGLAHSEAGRLEQAERCFAAALSLAPGRPSVLTNLGITRVRRGHWADALPLLEEALAAEPVNLEAWTHLGMARAELGQMTPALLAFERALAIDPRQAGLWSQRGSLLRELGRLSEAGECFERALALGADPQLHGYYLASVRDGESPDAAPRAYVESLFDRYADEFQAHLVGALRYRAHEVLVRGLAPLSPQRFRAVLDLGCGTGLIGPLIKPVADRVDGVDLSSGMLEQARACGTYTELVHADVVDYLQSTDCPYDLVLAADVFIYVGALDAVFAGVARVLGPGGLFAFSVELTADAHDLRLLPSLRYAHSQAYVHRLAREHGFKVRAAFRAPLREDQQRPIEGLYVYLQGR